MGASAYVGRIGGLAAALGIGAAVWLGCGVASADADGTGQTSSSASSGTESSASTKDASTKDASTTGSTTDRPTKASGTETSSSPTATTSVTTAKPAGTVTVTGRSHRGARSTPAGAAATTTKTDTGAPDESESQDPADTAPSETISTTAVEASPKTTVSETSAPVDPAPTAPADSPATWTVAAAARKETLVPATPTDTSTTTVKLAAAVTTAAQPPVVPTTPPDAVIQTPPLAFLQQIPVLGPVFVTPVVAAIHLIPIVGDIIHPFIGYPVQPGTPGAPVSRDVVLTSFDGTKIYVHFMPASGLQAGGIAPTILQGPGLGMPGSTSLEVTPLDGILTDALGAVGVGTLRHAGYNVVTWDPRGEYGSGGVLQLDSADFEAKDVSAIISWLAAQPEAQLDSPGDPRLGMVGASYGGGIQWVTAATDHRVDAIVPSISWNSLNTSLYKSDTFKSGWGTILTAALLLTGARPNPEIYPAAVQGALTGTLTEAQQALLAQRGPDYLLGNVTAPTLIIQGTVDTLFSLQEAQDNAAALMAKGVPTKVLWFCGGHGLCTNNLLDPTDGQVITDATLAWLARYVKGQDVSTGPTFEWVDQRGQYYSSSNLPKFAGAPIVAASSQAGTLPLVPLIGGSGPLLFGLPIGATKAANAYNLTIPAATTTTHVLGAPQLSLTYSGTGTSTHVFAQLVDDSTGAVLGNQATPIPVTLDGQMHTFNIPLEQVAQTLAPGQTITLQLVASTANYENFGAFGVLNVSSLQVSLPTITDAVARGTAPAAVLA